MARPWNVSEVINGCLMHRKHTCLTIYDSGGVLARLESIKSDRQAAL